MMAKKPLKWILSNKLATPHFAPMETMNLQYIMHEIFHIKDDRSVARGHTSRYGNVLWSVPLHHLQQLLLFQLLEKHLLLLVLVTKGMGKRLYLWTSSVARGHTSRYGNVLWSVPLRVFYGMVWLVESMKKIVGNGDYLKPSTWFGELKPKCAACVAASAPPLAAASAAPLAAVVAVSVAWEAPVVTCSRINEENCRQRRLLETKHLVWWWFLVHR
jgi:hypothetical protein